MTALRIILPMLASAAAVGIDFTKGWQRIALGAVVVAFLVTHGILELVQRKRAKSLRTALVEQRAEYLVTYFGALGPVSNQLSRMSVAAMPMRRELAGPALTASAVAARSLVPEVGTRAALFYRTVRDGVDVFLPHPSHYAGRGDQAQSKFFRGRGEGIDVWNAADAGIPSFYPDLSEDAPPNMDMDRTRTYAGFVTVPIISGDRPVGLVTVNTIEAKKLTSEDVGTLWVIAALAGTILGMVGGKWPGVDA